jgi:hypothetical protein
MPFLRRRGNTPIESETRPREADNSVAQDLVPDIIPSLPALQLQSAEMASASHDIQSRASSASQRPDTPTQEDSNRHKRFSLLRFRNASDSQLSLRAKQQAEKPPPVPRRMMPCMPLLS